MVTFKHSPGLFLFAMTVFYNSAFADMCAHYNSNITAACQPKLLNDWAALKKTATARGYCNIAEVAAAREAGEIDAARESTMLGLMDNTEQEATMTGLFNKGAAYNYQKCAEKLSGNIGSSPQCEAAVAKLRTYCTESIREGANTNAQTKQLEGAASEYTKPEAAVGSTAAETAAPEATGYADDTNATTQEPNPAEVVDDRHPLVKSRYPGGAPSEMRQQPNFFRDTYVMPDGTWLRLDSHGMPKGGDIPIPNKTYPDMAGDNLSDFLQ